MANEFEGFLDQLAHALADRISAAMGGSTSGAKSARGSAAGSSKPDGRRNSRMKGRKLDMTCRYPNCKNRSKGPRFSFMCEKHLGKKAAK